MVQGRRKLFSIWGGGLKAMAEARGLWGRFNRILIVRKSVLVCRNLQFSSTKWPKAYLINYYMLNKLQESVGNTMDCKITCTLLSIW